MRSSTKFLGPFIFFLIFTTATSIGYLHNAFADSGSQTLAGTTNINLDPFGVQQFFPQKAGKQQIVMGNDNPNSIPGFGFEAGGNATSQVQGQFHYYSIKPHTGALVSGEPQLTMRINLNPVGSSGSQVDWMTAEQQGYMVSPNDIDEFEQTGYFRIQSAIKDDDISLKQGGAHTSSHPSYAGSFGMEISYSGKYGKTAEKELNHPKYEFFNDPVALKTGSIVGKWIGVKEISRHTSRGQLYDVYVDLDPIDFATGLPKNNWQHLSSHLDDGKESGMYAGHITSWGKKYFTYRIDNAPNIDFALLSVHHIDTGPISSTYFQMVFPDGFVAPAALSDSDYVSMKTQIPKGVIISQVHVYQGSPRVTLTQLLGWINAELPQHQKVTTPVPVTYFQMVFPDGFVAPAALSSSDYASFQTQIPSGITITQVKTYNGFPGVTLTQLLGWINAELPQHQLG